MVRLKCNYGPIVVKYLSYFTKLIFILCILYPWYLNSIFDYIFLFTDPCTENDVRLNNNMVQVCHNAQWGFVCEHINSWNLRAAEVVCKQVGIESKSQLHVKL